MAKKKDVKRSVNNRNGNTAILIRRKSLNKLLFHRRRSRKKEAIDSLNTIDCNTISENGANKYPRYAFCTDIPEQYNETYIRVLPKNPEWMYVYWELGLDVRDSSDNSPVKGSKYVLRLKEQNTEPPGLFEISSMNEICDIEINPNANNYYLKAPQPGKEYIISIGQKTDQGVFESIATTEPFEATRFDIQEKTDRQWLLFSTDQIIDYSTGTGSVKEIQNSRTNLQADRPESYPKPYYGSAAPNF